MTPELQQGFDLEDCPFTILPAWENFPIVKAIRHAERATGHTYQHTQEPLKK